MTDAIGTTTSPKEGNLEFFDGYLATQTYLQCRGYVCLGRSAIVGDGDAEDFSQR